MDSVKFHINTNKIMTHITLNKKYKYIKLTNFKKKKKKKGNRQPPLCYEPLLEVMGVARNPPLWFFHLFFLEKKF
jgi:hypothetical protein